MKNEKSILVVDDNREFADVFCDILKSNNFNAESCYSGQQAVKLVGDKQYDTMFLDIRMPGMDGIETLREIKKIRPDTKVIMMTGYSVDEMVHMAIEENASEIVFKPFEIEKVLGLLN